MWSLKSGKNNGKLLNRLPRKVVAVAYRRWSFTITNNCKASKGNILLFLLIGGGGLGEVVAHGGSTVG